MGFWDEAQSDWEAMADEDYFYPALAAGVVVLLCLVVLGVRSCWRCRKARRRRASSYNSDDSSLEGGRRSFVAELVPLERSRRGSRNSFASVGSASSTSTSIGPRTTLAATEDDVGETLSDKAPSDKSERSSANSFYSCQEDDLSQSMVQSGFTRPAQREDRRLRPPTTKKKKPRRNKNQVQQYLWLEPLLNSIVCGEAGGLNARTHENKEPCTPLFVLAGTCPSKLPPAPMQAALFSIRNSGFPDMWWVKPKAGGKELESNTISRHASGAFKNAAGAKSSSAFDFLLKRFVKDAPCTQGAFTYGVDATNRAYIEELTAMGMRRRMLLYFIWVESYSTFHKTLEGKVCFERPALGSRDGPSVPQLRARQFSVAGGALRLGAYEDEEVLPAMMPGDGFQEMF